MLPRSCDKKQLEAAPGLLSILENSTTGPSRKRAEEMITALISRKGGVGKTTATVNLGAALAERSRSVLLVDLDGQSSASLSLGVGRQDLAPSIADIVLRGQDTASTIRQTGMEGVDLITSSTDLTDADRILAGRSDRFHLLSRALTPLTDRYDHILLDCPPALTLMPVAALLAADCFVVPVVPHFLAFEGVANLLQAANRLPERFGSRCELLGVLLNLVDYRSKLTQNNVAALRQELGSKVFRTEIRGNVRLAEAPAFGTSVLEHDPYSTGAMAFRGLAGEVLERLRLGLGAEASGASST